MLMLGGILTSNAHSQQKIKEPFKGNKSDGQNELMTTLNTIRCMLLCERESADQFNCNVPKFESQLGL